MINIDGNSITATTATNTLANGSTSGITTSGYSYTPNVTTTYPAYTYACNSWPYYDTNRVAALEGEVKVLKELVIALLASPRAVKPRQARARKK